MSIVLCGHETVNPQHDRKVYKKSRKKRDGTRDVNRVLFKRVKKTAVERKRRERGDEKVDEEDRPLRVACEPPMKRFDRMPRFLHIPAYQDYEEVDDRKSVYDMIQRMHRTYAECTAVNVRRCDKQLPVVQLQDEDDVEKDKEHRSEHNGHKPNAQRLEQIRVVSDVGDPQDDVKGRSADVIPVRVSVGVDCPHKEHEEHEDGSVQSHDRDHAREERRPPPQIREHGSFTLDTDNFSVAFLNHFPLDRKQRCAFANCVSTWYGTYTKAVRVHYTAYHQMRLSMEDVKQVLLGEVPAGMAVHQCAACGNAYTVKAALRWHQRTCK